MMVLTYYLLQLPPFLLFILFISTGGIIGCVGTVIFRKYLNINILKSHNEVTGFLFTGIASLYGFLLGFVIFVVWGKFNETQTNVGQEGSFAFGLYRDIKFYPDTTESKKLMVIYLDFVYNVVDEEFPNLARKESSKKTLESFNKVFNKMERLNPKTQFEIQLVGEMFRHLNELATYRGLRTSSQDVEIPNPMWWTLVMGAIIAILCAMLMDIENRNVHIVLNTLLGMFIAMFFFIIILLDHPFTGSLSIQPDSYMQIYNMEEWALKIPFKK